MDRHARFRTFLPQHVKRRACAVIVSLIFEDDFTILFFNVYLSFSCSGVGI